MLDCGRMPGFDLGDNFTPGFRAAFQAEFGQLGFGENGFKSQDNIPEGLGVTA